MRITTKLVIDMNTLEVLERESYEYSGPLTLMKDHGQDVANAQRQQQLNQQQAELDRQHGVQDQIKGVVSPYLTTEGQGYSPQQLAFMKSQLLNTAAGTYQQAGKSVRSALLSRGSGGGDQPVGGDYTRGIAALEGGQANTVSSGLLGVDLQNAQQNITNRFNSINALNGQATQSGQNIGIYGSGASDALNQYMAAKSIPGFGQTLGNSLANSLGKGIGAAATGGLGG